MNTHPDMFGFVPADTALPDGIVAFGPDDSDWPADVFAGLPLFGFDLIMADPPWHFATHSAKGQSKGPLAEYRTWTLRKIQSLPVGTLASGDAVLFLWCTSPLLLDQDRPSRSPVGEVIEAWGFRYGAFGGWAKRTKLEKTRWGTGYVMRSVMEPFIIATVGAPQHRGKASCNLINGLAREHSRKPDESYRWCERYMPKARRLDLCARQRRPGWEAWGNEIEKFTVDTMPAVEV